MSEVADYEVVVAALVPVKRYVRVAATSEMEARVRAERMVRDDCDDGKDREWSIPQMSRYEVDSDHDLLGPTMQVHHSAILDPIISGMNPRKISE